jgi:predicted RNase H-like nuclease
VASEALAGVDGCPGGWLALVRRADGTLASHCHADAGALFAVHAGSAVLAIDIPIGLPERGARACDREARARLGARRSSVFPASLRAVLVAANWEEACRIRARIEGLRMSRQAFGIVAKVREVDAALQHRPAQAARVHEVHPELSFAAWNGSPLAHPKKCAGGRGERMGLVSRHFGPDAFALVRGGHPRRAVADDDILHAFAALWSAERIARGQAQWLPALPPRDARGLRMQIVC